jgi:alpha-D-ribose 1-methylphosphonate 5-triphosphate diphosphatase PhnM
MLPNVIELFKDSVECHKCPSCGVAVPNLRTALTSHLTCIRCTVQVPIPVGVREKCGGGNVRAHVTFRMPDGSLQTQKV